MNEPYRQIFSEIEVRELRPKDSYEYFRVETARRQLKPLFYTSLAITSGGFRRDSRLPLGEAMENNGLYAKLLKEELVKAIPYSNELDFIVPSEIGKIKGWGQAEYMVFWSHVITGLDPKEAAQLEDKIELRRLKELPGFNDDSLSLEKRWESYQELIDRYVNILKQDEFGKGKRGSMRPQNIRAILLILDPEISLGVSAERYLCNLLGFKECIVSLNKPSKKFKSMRNQLKKLGVKPGIRDNLNQISSVQNHQNFWRMRSQGFRFRTSEVLTAIWEKRFQEY